VQATGTAKMNLLFRPLNVGSGRSVWQLFTLGPWQHLLTLTHFASSVYLLVRCDGISLSRNKLDLPLLKRAAGEVILFLYTIMANKL